MAEEGFKRKLAAILSADVEGYSRLMDDDEEATVRTLKTYRATINDLVQQYRGRIVDSPGDNILAEFSSVVDAVNCAVEIQRELAERNAELAYNRKMEFRIGVNLGDVIEDDGNIYGDGVNIAARVESLAEAGGICISGRAYDQVLNKLGLEYENLGEHQVKNISVPIRVYRVLSYPGAAAHRVVKARKTLGRRWLKIGISAAAIFVVAVAVGVWQFYIRRPAVEPASVEKMAFPLPEKPSIAVLPFVNMSGDPEQEYFSDGMSEDVITDLSKIPNFLVISRNSSFAFKGKSITTKKIAEDLGVRYVLEGSVRRAEDRVRINAQLIDAATGHHLWAERYDESIRNIFALQDKITHKIVSALAVKLTEDERKLLAQKETNSIEAYDAFLKASNLTIRMDPDRYAEAIPWFEKAIELDPNYSRAYAALAETYWYGTYMGFQKKLGISYRLSRIRRVNYLQKAMKNPTSISHRDAAFMYAYQRQHKKALDHAMRAIALDPNDAKSNQTTAFMLNYLSRYDEAIDFAKRSKRLDPDCYH